MLTPPGNRMLCILLLVSADVPTHAHQTKLKVVLAPILHVFVSGDVNRETCLDGLNDPERGGGGLSEEVIVRSLG